MKVSGIAGSTEVTDGAAPAFVVQAIAEYPVGDLALQDAGGRSLLLYWSTGRMFAMQLHADGDSEVAVERPAGSGPDIEFTLDNGQVDAWPWHATVDASHAGVLVEGWAKDRLPRELTWTRDPPNAG